MIVARLNDQGYITAFELATLSDFAKTYEPRNEGWVFADRPILWTNADYAAFMANPQLYYIDNLGELIREVLDTDT